ncbi:hypothetical protein HLB23_18745 [Nocardia uniformis]|uniref:Uncharacterized protein n=1 Tax=Nocardia uniformis TaxID=53432 RepID=A0A849C626_9NOCA|nr:hypothetical protein [Nocardia uniformis]NNH71870.1 hypothetical protein [Nocardia uniformis]
MNEIVAVPEAISRYGDAAAVMAANVGTMGAANQAATVAAVVPVFGLIGQDFLAAFAVAQANNLLSVSELAIVHAATAVTAYEGAGAYRMSEDTAVTDFGAIGRQ